MHIVKPGPKPRRVTMLPSVGRLQPDAAAVRLMAEMLVAHAQARQARQTALMQSAPPAAPQVV